MQWSDAEVELTAVEVAETAEAAAAEAAAAETAAVLLLRVAVVLEVVLVFEAAVAVAVAAGKSHDTLVRLRHNADNMGILSLHRPGRGNMRREQSCYKCCKQRAGSKSATYRTHNSSQCSL